MEAVAIRTGDELPVLQREVGDHLAVERRPGRASHRTRRRRLGSARRSAGHSGSPNAACELAPSRAGRRRGSAPARPSRPVSRAGIAFEVAATSMPRKSASASHVVTPGVSTSSGAASRSGNAGGRGIVCAISTSAAKSPRSQVTSVFSPAPAGARKSYDSLPPIIPGSRLHLAVLETDAVEDAVVRLALFAEALVEPLLVAVERVRVFHDELAHPDEALAAGEARRAP